VSVAATDHVTNEPQAIADIVGQLHGIAARRAQGARLWFHDPDAKQWREMRRWFPELTEDDVRADPFMVDQAINEWRECDNCQMGRPDSKGGVLPCNLKRFTSDRFYLTHVRLPQHDGEPERWEWRKHQCPGTEARLQEIATLEKRWQTVGGMKAVEVEDDAIPF
jgi:hypothetical protein